MDERLEIEAAVAQSRWPDGLFRKTVSAIREALRGSEQDFTQGSIGRAIAMLSIPMVLEMSMESLFAVVDIFFVARYGATKGPAVEAAIVSAVAITESLLTILYGVALGLCMATTAMVARRIGEKEADGAATAAVQAILLGVFISIPVALVGIFFTPTLFRLMGATPEVIAQGAGYGVVMIGANVVIMLLFLINAIFRGAGDAAIAMRTLWLANGINIILDPCLIFGLGPFPEMGVTGAAVATVIGRGIGVMYQFYVLARGNGRVDVTRRHCRPQWRVMLRLLRVSLGGMFQFLVATASWVALMRLVAGFGETATAGYAIAIRILIFALLPAWGMSSAAATLVGQNLGAGQPERAERSVWLTGVYNMAFLGVVTIVFVAFPEPIVRLFTGEPEVVAVGVDCLRYISYGYVFYAFGMVMVNAFNGAGDTATPTVINLVCYWLFQIPLAYGLAHLAGYGTRGVFVAITLAESLIAVVSVLMFRRGRWKRQQI